MYSLFSRLGKWTRELRSRVKYISGENRSVIFDVPAEGKGEFLTTAQISQKLIDFGSIKRPMPLNRLGMILGQQGYKCVRRGPQKQRGWLVYQRSTEEININKTSYAAQPEEGTGTTSTT